MGRFKGASARSVQWVVIGAGLLATSCAGFIGAGAAVVVVGAGVLTFTCYDRVSVTVTDRVTGTKLCDAKVTFIKGTSETVATSCYQAALSSGQYKLRVERRGLETFEEPVEVSESGQCGQTTQTMYIALDRKNRAQVPDQGAPPAAPVTVLPPAGTQPAAPVPTAPAPAATTPAPAGTAPAPAGTAPAPAGTAPAPTGTAPPADPVPPPSAHAPTSPAPATGAKPGASAFPDAP